MGLSVETNREVEKGGVGRLEVVGCDGLCGGGGGGGGGEWGGWKPFGGMISQLLGGSGGLNE